MNKKEVEKVIKKRLDERQEKIDKVGYLLSRINKSDIFYFNDEVSIWRRLDVDYKNWIKHPEEMYVKLDMSLSILSNEFDELSFLKEYDIADLLYIQSYDNLVKDTKTMLLDRGPFQYDGDVIITDPCFFLDGDEWDNAKEIYPSIQFRDNLYGDGDFCVVDSDDSCKRYGTYYAESGSVCTVYANEVDEHVGIRNLNEECYTLLKDFHGTILFRVDEIKFDERKKPDYALNLIGNGNINFHTIQIGF